MPIPINTQNCVRGLLAAVALLAGSAVAQPRDVAAQDDAPQKQKQAAQAAASEPGQQEQQVFTRYDQDNNGVLNEAEFSVLWAEQRPAEGRAEQRPAEGRASTAATDESAVPDAQSGRAGRPEGEPQAARPAGASVSRPSLDTPESTAMLPGGNAETPPTAQDDWSNDAQSIYQVPIESLKDRKVVSTLGEVIGTVKMVAVSTESGEPGLVVAPVAADPAGSAAVYELLAPVRELTISGDDVSWRTSQSPADLQQSRRFDAQQHQPISGEMKSLGEVQRQGLSYQR